MRFRNWATFLTEASEGRLGKDSVGLVRMVALSHAEKVVADSPELLAVGQKGQRALPEADLVIRRLLLEEHSADGEDQGWKEA